MADGMQWVALSEIAQLYQGECNTLFVEIADGAASLAKKVVSQASANPNYT